MLTRDNIKEATALFLVLDNIGSASAMVSLTYDVDKNGTQYGELSVETRLGGQLTLRVPNSLIHDGLTALEAKARERLTAMGIEPGPSTEFGPLNAGVVVRTATEVNAARTAEQLAQFRGRRD